MAGTRSEDALLTSEETARLLKISQRNVINLQCRRRYGMPEVGVERAVRFDRASLHEWLASQREGPAGLISRSAAGG
jgi:hypothetical protein